jgi:hypothetical protein
MAIALANLVNKVEEYDNLAGIPQTIYLARASEVSEWPVLPQSSDQGASIDTFNLLTGDLVMLTGKKLTSLYVTSETGEVKSELVGPLDGKSYKHSFEFQHPGTKEEVNGFSRFVKNMGLVMLIPDENRPEFYQVLGSKFRSAKMAKDDKTSGKKAEDFRASTFVFECYGVGPCPYVEITDEELAVLVVAAVAP